MFDDVLRYMSSLDSHVLRAPHCDTKKKVYRSADTKRAPRCASDIVELMITFVSSKFAVGGLVSSPQNNLSPPTVIRTQYFSALSGFRSHTSVAYVTYLPMGTSFRKMKRILSVPFISLVPPWARRLHSFPRLRVHVVLYSSFKSASIDCFFSRGYRCGCTWEW